MCFRWNFFVSEVFVYNNVYFWKLVWVNLIFFVPSSCSLLWGRCMRQETGLEKYLLLSILASYFFMSQVNLPMPMCSYEAKK